jgi:hypothetical protein
MPDWKEVNIARYLLLKHEKILMDLEMVRDPIISRLCAEIETSKEQLSALESGYKAKIHSYEAQMEDLKEQIKQNWDIEDKTFKCQKGSAAVKTTKSLIVTSKSGLIQRLTAIFEDATKACDCIRTFDLSAIRKYMDADLIDEKIAHYNKKQNVIITEARENDARKSNLQDM